MIYKNNGIKRKIRLIINVPINNNVDPRRRTRVVKVSIIIPVFNGEKFIERCLDSIVLSKKNLEYEVLVIDDGSTDSSFSIAKKYADKYDTVFAYTKENGGVSSARNFGLQKAKGTHVTFVDVDDYVTNDYFQVLNQYIDDFVCFNYYNNNKKESYSIDDLQNYFENLSLNSVCNKIYSLDIIKSNNIAFNERISMGEDFLFNLNIIQHVPIVYHDVPIYYYTANPNSATHNISGKHIKDLTLLYKEIFDFYVNDLENVKKAKCRAYRDLSYYIIALDKKYYTKEIFKIIIDFHEKYNLRSVQKEVGFKYKIIMFLARHKKTILLKLFSKIYRIVKR